FIIRNFFQSLFNLSAAGKKSGTRYDLIIKFLKETFLWPMQFFIVLLRLKRQALVVSYENNRGDVPSPLSP
ncbi:MAG: hypothetical protein FWC90_04355, partial [Oscillospiraceae bacterium]|nr:hypothetical protein [Oscillospiraceae bacterium]